MSRAGCVLVSCLLAAGIACRSNVTPRPTLPALPDLTGLDQSLQQQIRGEFETLERTAQAGRSEETAEALGRVGRSLLAAERYAGAGSFFTAAGALNSKDMRWPYYLGHVHKSMQQPEIAARFFEQSHRLDPNHVPSLIWLGDMQLVLGQPAAAEPYLTTAIELQPSSVAAWFHRGRAALAKGDVRQAIADLERARSLDPDSDPVYYQLGLAYRAAGDQVKAADYLKRRGDASSIVPDDPLMDSLQAGLESGAAYLTRGMEAIERRDWAAAVAHLRKAAELSPGDTTTHLNLGTALFLAGDRAAARGAFETAIRLSPELPKPRYTLGLLAESELKDPEAIEQFSAAVRLDPEYLEAHASLADALRRNGRVESSLAHYRKVLAVDPAASPARLGYGMGLVRLGRYREARAWFEQAATLHPEQPGFTHALARLLAAAPDDTVRDGRRALQLTQALLQSSQSWTLLETQAMAAAELGDFNAAIRLQEAATDQAIASAQRNAVAHLRMVLAEYRRGMACRTPWRADDPVFFPRPAA